MDNDEYEDDEVSAGEDIVEEDDEDVEDEDEEGEEEEEINEDDQIVLDETEKQIKDDEEQFKKPKEKLTYNIKKNSVQIIIPIKNKTTSDMISKYELTEAIGFRAADIEANGNTVINPADYNLHDSLAIAELEIRLRKIPYVVRRTMYEKGNKTYVEDWDIRQMIFPVNFGSIEINEALIKGAK